MAGDTSPQHHKQMGLVFAEIRWIGTYVINILLKTQLVFETKQEKEKFEKFVLQHKDQLSELAQKVHLPHFPDLEGYQMSAFKKQYADVYALKKMLDDFREVT